MSNIVKSYNVRELFESDNYVIPIYQRNYAWREPQIVQLIQDIVDYLKKDATKDYYIGTLIAWERTHNNISSFETIDGQQRLTTLSIILSLIKNEYSEIQNIGWFNEPRLKFDCRKNSTNTLYALFHGKPINIKDSNSAIEQAYKDIKKTLPKILDDNSLSKEEFYDYLTEKVIILRVLVPEDTDLNHYFEIMNTRGEQLEKHEILKVKCIEMLDESDRYPFSLIWEACSNMERYVQYGFNTTQRNEIFGNTNADDTRWNKLTTLDNVYSKLKLTTEESTTKEIEVSIDDLLNPKSKQYSENKKDDEERPDRFNTIINFSNFLLHVLRIQTKEDIPLDDKRLIETFTSSLKKEDDKKTFVKTFGYNLLKLKFLFDKYIIKREFAKGSDHWSLKRLKCYSDNKVSYVNTFEEKESDINQEILMLLSMFHVSAPTLGYKHWLNAALKYVFEDEEVEFEAYKIYLENLAKIFSYNILSSSSSMAYYDIIYKTDIATAAEPFGRIDIEKERLDKGTSVENFIFNYIDYLLWKNYRNGKEYFYIGEDEKIKDDRIQNFEYTFRSSVEHYYPQNPQDSSVKLKGDDEKWLDNFGNLCLISSRKNSKLNNYLPSAKKDHYQNSTTIDSVKQRIMMEYSSWHVKEIEEHGEKMKNILVEQYILSDNSSKSQ